jgi:catechol 2,3-dioxygenase-like lactoylglutathione lyase family enzyme
VIASARLTAFVASTDLDRSAAFYVDTLGLSAREQTPFALVLDGLGANLRVTAVLEKAATEYTVLGWDVDDLNAAVDDLRGRGITFTRYDGMDQDTHDAWTAPSGTRVAWFRDPDGNTLSLQQHPA